MIGPAAPAATDSASPCTGVCVIEPDSGWCIGCGRTIDEIAGWGGADEAARRAIRAALPQRMAALTGG